MSFEAEVIPLFITGVCAVSVLEMVSGCVLLKQAKRARRNLIAHTVSMLIAQVFLVRSLFANWLGIRYDIASISNSVNIGLLGLFWAVSVLLLLSVVSILTEDGGQES